MGALSTGLDSCAWRAIVGVSPRFFRHFRRSRDEPGRRAGDPKRKNPRCCKGSRRGARGTRTPDLLGAIQALGTPESALFAGFLRLRARAGRVATFPQFAVVLAGIGPKDSRFGPIPLACSVVASRDLVAASTTRWSAACSSAAPWPFAGCTRADVGSAFAVVGAGRGALSPPREEHHDLRQGRPRGAEADRPAVAGSGPMSTLRRINGSSTWRCAGRWATSSSGTERLLRPVPGLSGREGHRSDHGRARGGVGDAPRTWAALARDAARGGPRVRSLPARSRSASRGARRRTCCPTGQAVRSPTSTPMRRSRR